MKEMIEYLIKAKRGEDALCQMASLVISFVRSFFYFRSVILAPNNNLRRRAKLQKSSQVLECLFVQKSKLNSSTTIVSCFVFF